MENEVENEGKSKDEQNEESAEKLVKVEETRKLAGYLKPQCGTGHFPKDCRRLAIRDLTRTNLFKKNCVRKCFHFRFYRRFTSHENRRVRPRSALTLYKI